MLLTFYQVSVKRAVTLLNTLKSEADIYCMSEVNRTAKVLLWHVYTIHSIYCQWALLITGLSLGTVTVSVMKNELCGPHATRATSNIPFIHYYVSNKYVYLFIKLSFLLYFLRLNQFNTLWCDDIWKIKDFKGPYTFFKVKFKHFEGIPAFASAEVNYTFIYGTLVFSIRCHWVWSKSI